MLFSSRPVSDGRVADVVHEGSARTVADAVSDEAMDPTRGEAGADAGPNSAGRPREGVGSRRSGVAEVSLTGTLNGKPLWLKRRKGARLNQLFLEYDGSDLTRQVARYMDMNVISD